MIYDIPMRINAKLWCKSKDSTTAFRLCFYFNYNGHLFTYNREVQKEAMVKLDKGIFEALDISI